MSHCNVIRLDSWTKSSDLFQTGWAHGLQQPGTVVVSMRVLPEGAGQCCYYARLVTRWPVQCSQCTGEGADCIGMIVMVWGVWAEYHSMMTRRTFQWKCSSYNIYIPCDSESVLKYFLFSVPSALLSSPVKLCHLSISCPTYNWRPHSSKLTANHSFTGDGPHSTHSHRADLLVVETGGWEVYWVLTLQWKMSW